MAIRYLFEPRTGKCHALNTAIAAARGEVVAFLDDDSIPSRDWLTSIWSEFVADPGLGALAGRVELANPADLPIMIITGRKRRVARRFEEDVDGYFAGLNWAARRSMLTAVGEYDTHFGPGARFQSTEDLEFAYRMWRAGAKMLYAPSVLTFHNHGRRTEQASRALLWSYCIGRGAFYAKYLLRGDTYAARLIYWTIAWRARQILQGKDAIRHATTILGLARGFLAYTGFRLAQPLMTSVSSRSAAALRPEAAATERAEHAA